MKLVFILPGTINSGGVRVISVIGQSLLDRGHEVRLLYRTPDLTISDRVRNITLELLYWRSPNWINQFRGRIDSFCDLDRCRFDADEIIVAVGMAECSRLDLLHSLPNPKVQYLHGSTPYAPDLVTKVLKMSLPKIVVSSYLQELIQERGRGEEVVAIVHNGIDTHEYFCSSPESERDGVGTIYGQHAVKGPETVIAALDRLAALQPEVPLRVFSTDRRPKQISRRIYSRNPTLQRARDLYSRSLVWILGSQSEGFPAPVLEAMACGCAVVATDCGGPRDIIQNGVNGFLVPVGDPGAIVDRVQLLLGDASLRNSMQKRGQETVRRFTWDKCVTELETALELATHACV